MSCIYQQHAAFGMYPKRTQMVWTKRGKNGMYQKQTKMVCTQNGHKWYVPKADKNGMYQKQTKTERNATACRTSFWYVPAASSAPSVSFIFPWDRAYKPSVERARVTFPCVTPRWCYTCGCRRGSLWALPFGSPKPTKSVARTLAFELRKPGDTM